MASSRDIELISNTLANIYDWASGSIEDDFVDFIEVEVPNLKRDSILRIIKEFEKLPADKKTALNFNYREFVEKCLEA